MMSVFTVSAYADVSPVNQYDANGNLISGDGKYYTYNDANQLRMVQENDQNGKVVSEYFYDFSGQRVKKIENGVTTYYIGKHYEANVVAGKADNSSYFFADGERVAKKDSTGTYFYHPDHLGGVNAVTNSSGTVVAKTSYLPFGEIRQGGQEKYSYTGKEKDKATDLYYFDARYNNPELRHFTQADSASPDLSDPQDLNRYAYVGNNPLSYVDPDGHKKKKHHSKKEEKKLAKARAAANAEKKATQKAEEKQRAAADYAKHNPVGSSQTGTTSSTVVNDVAVANNYSLPEPKINNQVIENTDNALDKKKDDLRNLYYELKNNGTLNDSFQSQDNICSDIAYPFNISAEARSCCIEHDNCYSRYLCNASSWITMAEECGKCNSSVSQCIMKVVNRDIVGVGIMINDPIAGMFWDLK